MKKSVMILLAAILLLSGCADKLDGDGMVYQSYRQISQEKAREMMARDDGHIVVDVRRQDEYDVGHIPGAILIPNEEIEDTMPEALPDLDQIILIYCRSGNRSKQAAQKLFDMGYTNIYEFGGIDTWTGEIETENSSDQGIWTATEQPVSVRYDRMWEDSDYAETSDPHMIEAIIDAVKALRAGEPTDMVVEDYTDILTFTFTGGGTLRLEFEEQNWVKDDGTRCHVEGLSTLRNLLEEMMRSSG